MTASNTESWCAVLWLFGRNFYLFIPPSELKATKNAEKQESRNSFHQFEYKNRNKSPKKLHQNVAFVSGQL